ncbi:YegS/Rv2252/BmrU family lipid kinase [Chitinophaga sedimenti]|uniref:diacylglycerol/lipid kinase family protein n=1 Tax=Chitinophaga sedimenti TaxID=2033606 RepID=UPI0020065861|nr:YegS/Rv2252/BmrU family lipid kinase [Chitinophaga sedimenti]MCK7558903.1 YegS/Rv2252/BmrU family lipid kinase [Chitinophaga sedimenti]
MKKILIIINRKAGTDREKRMEQHVQRYLPENQFEVNTRHLEYLGHGADLAREAVRDGVHVVVAVGGDGSINEIAQGLVGGSTALAIVPRGSGNGLARALKIPLDVPKALQLVAANKQLPMDVGYANEYLFLSNAGVGFDALIADRFRHSKKRGLVNYARLILSYFRRYRPEAYDMQIDGSAQKTPAFLLTVANGNQFGYEFKIAPPANVFDGVLDVCIVKPVRFWDLLPISIRSLAGNIHKSRYMQHERGKEIVVSSPGLDSLQVDGDAVELKGREVRFHVVPAALRIIVP